MSGDGCGNDTEVVRIKAKIENLINDHFEHNNVYYLSRLGMDLGDDRLILEKRTGKKLAQFVQDSLQYEVGREGPHKNVLYLIAPKALSNAPPSPTPRYLPRFWAAFMAPLGDGEERYVNIDTLEFGPKEKLIGNSQDVRPIASDFIASAASSGSAVETAERISRWLKQEQLDGERFHVRTKRSRPSGESLLDQVLSALDRDQLRRISLPLDVIKCLADRRS